MNEYSFKCVISKNTNDVFQVQNIKWYGSRIWHELSPRNIENINAWLLFYQNTWVRKSYNKQLKMILAIVSVCNENAVRTFCSRDQGVAKKDLNFSHCSEINTI